MAKCSKIVYGLANRLDIGVPAVAIWMGKKEELYLFNVEHHNFGGVILVYREIELHGHVIFFLGTRHSKVVFETSKYF